MEIRSNTPEYLTTREVAELLRVKERKVYEMAAAEEIPCRRVTGKLLFPRAELEAWLIGEQPPSAAARPRALCKTGTGQRRGGQSRSFAGLGDPRVRGGSGHLFRWQSGRSDTGRGR